MPPTGVPVELITHSADDEWFVGTSSVLPVGQLVGTGVGWCHGVNDWPPTEIDAPDADKPAKDATRSPAVTSEARTERRRPRVFCLERVMRLNLRIDSGVRMTRP
jgi:hypothetical protein